ncbi:DNA-directed RNA polymerase I subunit RPA49 [Vigna unguiculata]|uniref:DNA-directed RNA polymerase I subunit RPA49 n=1 Tax=Vigna unguiculata TaxID=3917 RepID=UPI00101680A3|nr:DNA-directed RNA polymerase I subunit RPA49 [Vigna unguiculata]
MDSDTNAPKSKTPKKEKNKKNKKQKDVPPEPDRIEVAVEVVHEHPNKTAPVVGYFPSGFDPVKNYASGSGPSEFQLYRHRNMSKRMQLVVRPPGSSVEFVGSSFSGEAAAGHRAMFALGLLDKEAGTLKIVPIAGNKIFRLEPKIKGMEAADNEPANSTLEEMTPQQKIAETTSIWGTKRDIEKAKKKLALKQDEDPNSQRNLDVKLKNVSVNKSALESTESHVSRNIPPYDTSATTPQEAYVLDKIILTGEWDYLQDIYKNLHQEEKTDFSSYPTFVRNRVERLRKIKDESEQRKLSCILSYINHLIKFKDQHSFDVFSAKSHKIPNILRHKFTNMFAVSELRRLPPEKISLLVSYVLVLTLFADDFLTDCTDIAKDLSMNVMAVRQVYEQLGCKFTRQKSAFNGLRATLPVPLKFPELTQRKRKR